MKTLVVCLLVLLGAPVGAQESLRSVNPLSTLKDELAHVLAEADVPFSNDQERAIALMMEERLQASEGLFGGLMDFRSGPTSVQEADRLGSAIEWMQTEFITRVRNYLTAEQLGVWNEFEAAAALTATSAIGGAGREPQAAQTQYVRINNNTFSSESFGFQRGAQGGTEVIQRGGVGSWYGNAQFVIMDEALNARNAFASNKPPYQERQVGVDLGGPILRNRLTTTLSIGHSKSENVDTVRATLPDGVFALGITRPTTNRSINSRSTYQLFDAHSLRLNVRRFGQSRENQGVGGFNLPERASSSTGANWNVDLRQFSSLRGGSLYETRLSAGGSRSETIPVSETLRINVLDAFNGGGAQNRSSDGDRSINVSNLYTRPGERLTIKTGMDATLRTSHAFSTSNFGGTFTFSSLEAYLAGRPLTYQVTQGDPALETRQMELAGFIQHDLNVAPQFTLMAGLRYDVQTNLRDRNNLSPRVGFAYSLGRSTILRGGGGLFYSRLGMNLVETQRRLDGTRQFELVIDGPSYPEPFLAGSARQTFPSVRVTDPHLAAPRTLIGMVSVERTLWTSLFVTAMYDYQSEIHRFRLRNLNAPFDRTAPSLRSCQPGQPAATCLRPDPTRGNIANLESTGNEISHNLRVTARQRFSIFNVSGDYTLQHTAGDTPGVQLPMDNYDLRLDWGRSNSPLHSVNTTVNARLPLGVFLTGAMSANSGRYYTITTGRDDNRDTSVNDRPPGVPRNGERGPSYLNFNFNISKAVFLGQSRSGTRRNVNLFANMSNALNRVHYGTPSGVMTSPNFGRSTNAQDPREIEVGVRFQF